MGSNTTSNPNKWALLIGINEYPKFPAYRQLSGCLNDIELMADTLHRIFGFPPQSMTRLENEQATRDGILNAMEALLSRVSPNDIVVLHYSGHGSRVRDREGDEPDGWDETIVPYDAGHSPHPFRDITDDEIYVWLLRLTQITLYVTLIFDSCYSGAISRDAFGDAARWVESDERSIEELPPSLITSEEAKAVSEGKRDIGASGWLPLGKRYVLLAGCRNDESSYECHVGAVKYGLLTYHVCQELIKAKPGTTYRDVFERASIQMGEANQRQHPQLEGARDRELFGLHDIEPMLFVPVKHRIDDTVILAAGAAHGMTVGSQWALYPQTTKQVMEATPKLGLVEITNAYAVTSEARILSEENTGVITPNARAVEVSHFYGDMRLKVSIPKQAGVERNIAELSKRIEQSPLLSLIGENKAADVCAFLLLPRAKVAPDDPMPQLGALTEATWAMVGGADCLVMPMHAISESCVIDVLCDNLEKIARYRNTLGLKNQDQKSLLKDKVELILLKQTHENTWEEAKPDLGSGEILYRQGDRIAVRVTNRHSAPVYISILDFGLTGAIGLLHPIEGASEALEAGRTIQIGVREGDEIMLEIPENYPYTSNLDMHRGEVEMFKLLATTHEADFSLLIQERYRDRGKAVKGAASPLGQLLEMALTGHGMREAKRKCIAPNEEWTTVERKFFLEPAVRA